jgi:hypothetical protein
VPVGVEPRVRYGEEATRSASRGVHSNTGLRLILSQGPSHPGLPAATVPQTMRLAIPRRVRVCLGYVRDTRGGIVSG